MIVKMQKAGRSFKGLGKYLTEDKQRVAWTHSLNCANDDTASVVHEMYTTYSQADYLKEQANVHGGGNTVNKPVKHISLNWPHGFNPSREEMIAACESHLEAMGWQEHQALLVAHNDKEHMHVHIMLNRIHPETGRALDDGFDRFRASEWRRDYNRDHGHNDELERLQQREQRSHEPSRETWEVLREAQRGFETEEKARWEAVEGYLERNERTSVIHGHEWELLREAQKQERLDHFEEGRHAFRELRKEIYREVREEFRERWADYYAEKRAGADPDKLDAMRADILTDQREVLKARRDEACAVLRAVREEDYKDLLSDQVDERDWLRSRQGEGLTSPELLDRANTPGIEWAYEADDTSPANENRPETRGNSDRRDDENTESFGEDHGAVRDPLSGAADLGAGIIGAIATVAERLFDGFLGGKPAPEPDRRTDRKLDDETQREREAGRRQRIEQAIRDAAEERELQRDRAYWVERERTRG